MSVAALIVAAGRGTRLGGTVPKQYLRLAGRPVLWHSIAAFVRHPRVDLTHVVLHPDDSAAFVEARGDFDMVTGIAGGETRQQSVLLGLESLADRPPDQVLIHDGARPLVDAALISRTLDALAERPGAIAALPVTDTLKRAADGIAHGGIDRNGLWRAQTPQAFRFAEILAAHRAAAGAALTDDAAVAERAGLAVSLVAGTEDNIKITTAGDLERAERLLLGRLGDVRVGSGFDVHGFAESRALMLCGIAVPHERGLAGHSDADVGIHALVDAILGALSAGDIGVHFPPSDERWRGAASAAFLQHAAALVAARGGAIAHVDVTLICERPKIGPHRAAMRAKLAELLHLPLDRVSVKATTTEKLGFTGRGEGIAAQATATLRLP